MTFGTWGDPRVYDKKNSCRNAVNLQFLKLKELNICIQASLMKPTIFMFSILNIVA